MPDPSRPLGLVHLVGAGCVQQGKTFFFQLCCAWMAGCEMFAFTLAFSLLLEYFKCTFSFRDGNILCNVPWKQSLGWFSKASVETFDFCSSCCDSDELFPGPSPRSALQAFIALIVLSISLRVCAYQALPSCVYLLQTVVLLSLYDSFPSLESGSAGIHGKCPCRRLGL